MVAALQFLTEMGYQWLYFGITLFAVFMSVVGVFVWLKYAPKRRKRKRKHHGHGRINPTRAQVGGLPAARPSEQQRENGQPPADSAA